MMISNNNNNQESTINIEDIIEFIKVIEQDRKKYIDKCLYNNYKDFEKYETIINLTCREHERSNIVPEGKMVFIRYSKNILDNDLFIMDVDSGDAWLLNSSDENFIVPYLFKKKKQKLE